MAFFLTLIRLGFINAAFIICQDRSEETIILYVHRRSKICHRIFMKTALGMIPQSFLTHLSVVLLIEYCAIQHEKIKLNELYLTKLRMCVDKLKLSGEFHMLMYM